VDLAEEIFHMPVRLGSPRKVGGLKGEVDNPIHSTGVGLLIYGARQMAAGTGSGTLVSGSSDSLWERMKGWFNGNL